MRGQRSSSEKGLVDSSATWNLKTTASWQKKNTVPMFVWEFRKTENLFGTYLFFSQTYMVPHWLNEEKNKRTALGGWCFPSITLCDSEIYKHLSASVWQQFGSHKIGYSAERLQRVKQKREPEQWQDHNGMLETAYISSRVPSAGILRECHATRKKQNVFRETKNQQNWKWNIFSFS